MKKILITGASGFIGSFLVEEALKLNFEVWAGIRNSSNKEYLTDKKINFIDLAYTDKEILKKQIENHEKWDYIIHNAGVTKCLDQKDFEKINFTYTKHLVEALKETGKIPDKFILMSSLSTQSKEETAYSKSKLKSEQLLLEQTNFPFIIFRATGVYGPREKDYYLMTKSIKAGFDATIGFKPQLLTFIYVKDLTKAIFLSIEQPIQNKIYPITDGYVYTDKEFTEIIRKILNKRFVIRLKIPLFILKGVCIVAEEISKIIKKPSTLNRDKYKIMKQRDWRCDTKALEEELGFKADYPLFEGMKETIHWYKDNGWL